MTDKYKMFWVTDHTDNSGLTVTDKYNHKTMFGACNVYEVIELAALEACQKRLDEACELLKKTLKHFEDPYTDSNPMVEIDEFLKGLGEG